VPFFAFGLFAGVRTKELLRMDWSMIDLKHDEIRLPAEITKKKRKRTIKLEPCLKSWIADHAKVSGPVVLSCGATTYTWRTKIHKAAGVESISNGMRHAFGSHGYEHYPLAKLLEYMGHRSSDVLVDHYRGEAREEQATEYFKLFNAPEKVINLRMIA
jgi:integrase